MMGMFDEVDKSMNNMEKIDWENFPDFECDKPTILTDMFKEITIQIPIGDDTE